jgi:hypothetical protein
MKYHFQKKHQELIHEMENHIVQVRVQTLKTKPYARYFNVIQQVEVGEDEAIINDPNLQQFLDNLEQHCLNVEHMNVNNRKAMLSFPYISGWKKYLSAISGNEQAFEDLCKKPTANEKVAFYTILVKLCVQFLREIRVANDFNSYNAAVAIYEGLEKPKGFMPFKRTEVANTDIRYAKVLASVILFFRRVMQLPANHVLIKVEEGLHQKVKDATMSVINAIQNEEYDLDGFQMDVDEDVEDDGELFDMDPEVAEDLEDIVEENEEDDNEEDNEENVVDNDELDGNEFEEHLIDQLNQNEVPEENNDEANDEELELEQDGNVNDDEEPIEEEEEEFVNIEGNGRNCVFKFVRKISSQVLNQWEDREKLHLFSYVVIHSMYGQKGGMNNGSAITRRLAFLEYAIRGASLLDSKVSEQALYTGP